ncbi:MAG: SLATT domain-containing protein [Candidatus Gastranaerophilales bacterium]|nr:SLATT domain-containing protein [Candidatus Gastranaerophilales bacterium]
MDKQQPTTAEKPVSKTKDEIIKEAKRVEECLLYSSKGHFAASYFWGNFHLWIGVPVVLLSAVAGASALSQFDPKHVIAGLISILVAALSGVMTFLNPNEKASVHLNAGNNYDSLMNKVRIFWSIDCWRDESEQVLTEKLKYISEQKDKLNQSCPQVPRWAYNIAKKGIRDGEGDYTIDKNK